VKAEVAVENAVARDQAPQDQEVGDQNQAQDQGRDLNHVHVQSQDQGLDQGLGQGVVLDLGLVPLDLDPDQPNQDLEQDQGQLNQDLEQDQDRQNLVPGLDLGQPSLDQEQDQDQQDLVRVLRQGRGRVQLVLEPDLVLQSPAHVQHQEVHKDLDLGLQNPDLLRLLDQIKIMYKCMKHVMIIKETPTSIGCAPFFNIIR